MKNSLRGALWSALVLPGSGQIVLKHWKRGLPFALASITGVILIAIIVVKGTWTGLEQQALQGNDFTLSDIAGAGLASLKTAGIYVLPPLLVCWLLSVVDAWRLGREGGA